MLNDAKQRKAAAAARRSGSREIKELWRSRNMEPPMIDPVPFELDTYEIDQDVHCKLLVSMLANLNLHFKRNEFEILFRKFVVGETLEEISVAYGISREAVRDRINSSIRKISNRLRRERKAIGFEPSPSPWFKRYQDWAC